MTLKYFSRPCLSMFFIKRKRNKVQRQQTGWFQRAETQPRKRYNKGKITQSAIRDPAIYQATTRAVLVAYNLPRTRQSTRPAAGRVTEVPSWRHDQKFVVSFLPHKPGDENDHRSEDNMTSWVGRGCRLVSLLEPRQAAIEQQHQHQEVADGDQRDQPGVVPG